MVAFGGACGAASRFLLDVFLPFSGLPWATFTANVLGCFLIGASACLLAPGRCWYRSGALYQGVNAGFLGGFTTFAVFSHENLALLLQGEIGLALIYIAGTVMTCLVSVGLGDHAGRRLDARFGSPA